MLKILNEELMKAGAGEQKLCGLNLAWKHAKWSGSLSAERFKFEKNQWNKIRFYKKCQQLTFFIFKAREKLFFSYIFDNSRVAKAYG